MITTLNKDKESNFLIICDHASNHIPPEYNGLGLSKTILDTHIAYDIGVKEVAVNISKFLKCPLVMTNFSRLLIDTNRGVDDPTLIMKISDDNVVDGNKNISFQNNCDEKKKRIKFFYEIYHSKISDIINKAISKNVFPAIISIHSFTPLWKGKKRSTDLGILWDSDDRLSNIFFSYLNKNYKDMDIGNNIPYSGRMKNDTLFKHGTSQGLANILIEIRQDLILDSKKQLKFSKLITKPLMDNVNNLGLFRKKFYKSFAK
ncbi:N-formylglutamate amidohydrolase [Hyphomicrobiales bacterium]|nr:N-formylglutamate amidohydrolase [Hyphomicrobiales bacterium]